MNIQPTALNFEVTPVFVKNMRAKTDIVLNRGGTRSSKTYSIAQLFVTKLVSEKNKRFLISRKTTPALRLSVKETILEILKGSGVFDYGNYNKTEGTFKYYPTGSVFHFVAVDDPQKFRGPEWNYVWLNECNEFTYEDFKQVHLRLTRESADGRPNMVYMDFNPSSPYSWVKTEIEDKREITLIKSSYLDNTFLTKKDIKRITWYKENDPDFWKIYGLGEYGEIRGLIFQNWETVPAFPECNAYFYGLDWGFSNDPTALIKLGLNGGFLYLEELIYSTGLTNSDIINQLKEVGLNPRRTNPPSVIYADPAEPKSIEDLTRAGWVVKGAKKGPDSIRAGIDLLKRYPLKIVASSTNLIKEFSSYKWKVDREGRALNVPIDRFNHGIDAIRYGATMNLKNPHKKLTWE